MIRLVMSPHLRLCLSSGHFPFEIRSNILYMYPGYCKSNPTYPAQFFPPGGTQPIVAVYFTSLYRAKPPRVRGCLITRSDAPQSVEIL